MKKLIIIILSLAAVAVALYVTLPYISSSTTDSHNKQLRVAIFTPTTHPALEEIEQGFKETLQKLDPQPYVFTTFNANGNRTLLRAQAEEIVNGNFDLIFTIGAGGSQTVAELLSKKGIHTPHVFAGVDGPAFAQSLAATNNNSTGSYVQSNYKGEMDILHKLKPSTKNILLVYDPSHGTGLEKFKKEIEAYIQQFGTTLNSIEVYQTNEIQQKVASSIPNNDVVLVLTDNTVVAGIDALIALCNRYGVTLLASDLASGKKGAALAYGITEYESGSSGAHKAYEILMLNKQPETLPISAITNFKVELNKDTMHAQNLNIDPALLNQFNQ